MTKPWYKRIFDDQPNALEQKNVTEPTFVMTYTILSDGQVKLDQQWNPEFIKELRKKGFMGTSDEQIIDRFITMINTQQQILDMEQDRPNEYR